MSTAPHAGQHSTNHHTPDLHDDEHQDHHEQPGDRALTRLAVSATLHCLTGCAIGEILGLVLATWWGWSDLPSIVLAIALAFVFGYALTIWPVLRSGLPLKSAITIALAADTLSILTMEIVDNAILLAIPGAMDAGLTSPLFWGSLAFALAVAFVVTVPVNRWLLTRGKGHAAVHRLHTTGHAEGHGTAPADDGTPAPHRSR